MSAYIKGTMLSMAKKVGYDNACGMLPSRTPAWMTRVEYINTASCMDAQRAQRLAAVMLGDNG